MDELYLSINTDLIPHDLVHLIWDELFTDWFQIGCVATDKAEFVIGDLADDTKLDGRGRLALEGENQSQSPSHLKSFVDSDQAKNAILQRLDLLSLNENPESFLQISCIGEVPSGFRTYIDHQWRPRFSPSFNFIYGKSSFEISFFDADWIHSRDDLDQLVDRLSHVISMLGNRRLTQIEFESDGQFLIEEDIWRLQFATLPITPKNLR